MYQNNSNIATDNQNISDPRLIANQFVISLLIWGPLLLKRYQLQLTRIAFSFLNVPFPSFSLSLPLNVKLLKLLNLFVQIAQPVMIRFQCGL